MIRKLLFLLIVISPWSQAQELSRSAAQRAEKAYQLAQDEQLAQAIKVLESQSSGNEYDNAYLARMLGIFYWQNKQPQRALTQLEMAVNSGLLDKSIALESQRMLADLLLSEQQYKKALHYYYPLSENIAEGEKQAMLWLRIAQAHYQINEWQQVISAIDRYLPLQKQDEVQALSLRLGALQQLQRWQQASHTLKRLIQLQVNEAKWWRQLVSIQLTLNKQQDALNTLALAKLQDVELSEREQRLLAQLYAQQGIPERAARLMAELANGNDNQQYLLEQVTYWQMAKEWEKAIALWRRLAEKDPQYYWNLASLLIQQEHYQDSLTALAKVEGRKAEVALAQAQVYFKLDRIEDALFAAKNAEHLQASARSQSWIKYLTQIRRQTQSVN